MKLIPKEPFRPGRKFDAFEERKKFGAFLRERRLEQSMSQVEVALRMSHFVETSNSFVSSTERGITFYGSRRGEALARALGCVDFAGLLLCFRDWKNRRRQWLKRHPEDEQQMAVN